MHALCCVAPGSSPGYPWSWVCVVGLVAVVHMMAGTFAADAWLDDSTEWLYDVRIVLAVLVLTAAPVVALGFVGRLVFGNVRHLARIGALAWALTLGLVNGLITAVQGDEYTVEGVASGVLAGSSWRGR